jgi:hypothetical protein
VANSVVREAANFSQPPTPSGVGRAQAARAARPSDYGKPHRSTKVGRLGYGGACGWGDVKLLTNRATTKGLNHSPAPGRVTNSP